MFFSCSRACNLPVTRSSNIMNKKLLVDFLKKDIQNKSRINVIGDSMVDEYHIVDVNRISPEFPIPIYKSDSLEPDNIVPGGAANVAFQFKHFNVSVELISLLDKKANIVCNLNDINTNYSRVLDSITMPTKKRMYADSLPIVRWDIEKENYGLDDIKKTLLDIEIPDSDFNIFSDYSKGVFCCPWFRRFFKNSKSLVDPKNKNLDFWQDCTVLKPNAIEAKQLSDRKNWRDQIDFFINSLRCSSVVITQAGDGVVGKDHDYFEHKYLDIKTNPNSVIGAGDCFGAFLCMALTNGFSLEEASIIAFTAGSFYVTRKLNRPICGAELLSHAEIKIIDEPDILKNRNFKLVATNGCFDLLHAGHIETLNYAKKQGDKLCVLVNSDKSIKELKGESRPILTLDKRLQMLASLDMIDYIISFDEQTPETMLRKFMPDVLVKGAEYTNKNIVGSTFIKEVKLAPMVSGFSTSNIIEKIKSI